MADKKVVVAGAGDNMGRAVPRLLAREGADLLLVSRNREHLEETARLTAAGGRKVVSFHADLAAPGTAERVAERAHAELGGIDALVYLAGGGFQPDAGVEDLTEATWDAVIETTLTGPFHLVRALLPELARRRGSVTFVTAGTATRQMGSPAYAASKGGVEAFALNLARRLWARHVRVNVVQPGLIWYRHDGLEPPPDRGLDRFGAAVDVAYAVLYLCSDEAAWVTGVCLRVDGGDDVLLTPAERRRGN
jgi:NAD(P)-dependent dehydrogenase (short-subunit alcohol dehydrogenase family)